MSIRLFATAASAAFICLSVATGGALAQSGTDTMKKSDSMKTESMSKDGMKADSMKMGGTKADCMHKASMEKDSMKKSGMMKACDAMK